jgi:hypothetical protein
MKNIRIIVSFVLLVGLSCGLVACNGSGTSTSTGASLDGGNSISTSQNVDGKK